VTRHAMHRHVRRPGGAVVRLTGRVATLTCAVWMLAVCPLAARGAQGIGRPSSTTNPLRDLSASVEELTKQVSPSVVQVLVTGYGPLDDRSRETGLVFGRHSIASGAIIDSTGYIITNAHVVAGAQRVQVLLHGPAVDDGPVQSLAAGSEQMVDARIVGTASDIDLALLKVEATGLHALPLADYDKIRQGELVFAFGSPEGLLNSVTMGVVSSIARQPDPDSPRIYIQTDAPINPGNSGGPLVNVDGELVGLNTFILTESGGSQGLGFAIPSVVVAMAYPQLRRYGHLHRGMIGINVQAITPALATGLGLSRTSGVIVSDVMPDRPADIAGVQVQDIVATVNGKTMNSVPMLELELSTRTAGDTVMLGLVRGSQTLSLTVAVIEQPDSIDRLSDLADPATDAIRKLGIVGVDITDTTATLLSGLRISSGVLVAAREQQAAGAGVPLVVGDVIHALNGFAVRSLDGLRVLVDGIKTGSEVVVQLERDGRLMFITFPIY
jgi:serine protease Do